MTETTEKERKLSEVKTRNTHLQSQPGDGAFFGWLATREEVFSYQIPKALSKDKNVLPYEQVIPAIIEAFSKEGFIFERERYAVKDGGYKLKDPETGIEMYHLVRGGKIVGILDTEDSKVGDFDFRDSVLFRMAIDGSMARIEFFAGGELVVCMNLNVWGSAKIKLEAGVNGGIASVSAQARELAMLIALHNKKGHRSMEEWQLVNITDEKGCDIICSAVASGSFPGSKIGKVIGEWRQPSYEWFRDRNLFSLYNAFTTVANTEYQPSQRVDKLQLVTNLFREPRALNL